MQNYLDKGIHTVIIKIQEYINRVSALSFVLFYFSINNLDDGIENTFIKLADDMNLGGTEWLSKIQNYLGK